MAMRNLLGSLTLGKIRFFYKGCVMEDKTMNEKERAESKEQRKKDQRTGARKADGRLSHSDSVHGSWPAVRPALLFIPLCFVLCSFLFTLSTCDLYFGALGGADQYVTDGPGSAEFERILAGMSGVWYSHYGKQRLDGYRIGKFGVNGANFEKEMGQTKLALFPSNGGAFEAPYPLYQGGEEETYLPQADDYYLFCDDTVYGQNDQGEGGNGGWGSLVTRYAGIVRAVNVFNHDEKTGALIVQYFQGCAPTWSADIKDGRRPFFGMYYRVQSENVIQMANAVDLAALYAGGEYYTETATLEEAVEKNNVVNDSEFIAWGIVWPQDRER
jgi:hypothetical protein